jgi:phosphoglycerol transferase
MMETTSVPVITQPGPLEVGSRRSPVFSAFLKEWCGYLGAASLSLLLVVGAWRLWRGDLTVPIEYGGANQPNLMWIKGTLENGWYFENPRVGMPLTQKMYDFPLADALHFGVIKVLGWFFPDPAVVLNIYILLPFPLTALSTFFVLRRFRLGRLPALVAAVLYACAPYHFSRSLQHIFLAAYYLLPLMALVLLRIYLGRLPFSCEESGANWRFFRWKSVGAVLVCALVGISGVYYAFFSCFLLLTVGVKVSFRERRWLPLAQTGILVAVVTASTTAAIAPCFLYWAEHGRNAAVAGRLPAEADMYGLNVTEMLVPLPQHYIGFLGAIRTRYMAPPRQPTGEQHATLGLLASLGFLYLLGRFLWRRPNKTERIEDGLAYLTVAAVMLGTLGGLGAAFSFCVSPMIRCYNRISIFIAFFAVFALFLLLDRLAQRLSHGRRAFLVYLGAGALLLVGAVDQIARWHPDYATTNREYASDSEFGKRIEDTLPAGSMVYQMPFVPFPEHPRVGSLPDDDLIRPYLHTKTLRWSVAAMKGREASNWQAALARRPLPEVVRTLAFAGFAGIYLDRAGFADHGVAVEKYLARILGVEGMVSLTGRQVFFDMRRYLDLLHRYHEADWEARRDDALHPVSLTWTSFSPGEHHPVEGTFHWCGPQAELRLVNPREEARSVVLKMEFSAWQTTPARLVLEGDLIERRDMEITDARRPLELKLEVPPGEHHLHLDCDGPVLSAPGDPRTLVFRVWNIDFKEER